MRLILLISLCLPLAARAEIFTARIDASSTTITTSFVVVPGLTSVRSIRGLLVDNRTGAEIAVNCSTSSGRTPSDTHNVYVDSVTGAHQWAIDAANLGNACFVKSMSGDISTGIVIVTVIGS